MSPRLSSVAVTCVTDMSARPPAWTPTNPTGTGVGGALLGNGGTCPARAATPRNDEPYAAHPSQEAARQPAEIPGCTWPRERRIRSHAVRTDLVAGMRSDSGGRCRLDPIVRTKRPLSVTSYDRCRGKHLAELWRPQGASHSQKKSSENLARSLSPNQDTLNFMKSKKRQAHEIRRQKRRYLRE